MGLESDIEMFLTIVAAVIGAAVAIADAHCRSDLHEWQ